MPICLAFVLAILATGAPATAADREDRQQPRAVRHEPGQEPIVVTAGDALEVGRSGEKGPTIHIINADGRHDVIRIDLQQIGELIQEAIGDVSDELADLSDLQIDLQLGPDSRVAIHNDDEELELDLSAIACEVKHALAAAMAGIQDFQLDIQDFDADTPGSVQRHQAEVQALRDQLEKMHEEISDLKQELRKLRQRQRH